MTADPQLRWLRLWTDVTSDPKILSIAFEDRWHFIALLCMKRRGDLDGDVERRNRYVSVTLGVTQGVQLDELKNRLIEAQLIDATWSPLAWDKRQYKSDQGDGNAAERMKRYRERKRNDRNPVTAALRPEQRRAEQRKSREETPFPPGLDEVAWMRWEAYRREQRKPIKPASVLAAQRKLAGFGAEQAAVVEESIAQGWTGLFALKPGLRAAPAKPERTGAWMDMTENTDVA